MMNLYIVTEYHGSGLYASLAESRATVHVYKCDDVVQYLIHRQKHLLTYLAKCYDTPTQL